jgi:hypothetical protein
MDKITIQAVVVDEFNVYLTIDDNSSVADDLTVTLA